MKNLEQWSRTFFSLCSALTLAAPLLFGTLRASAQPAPARPNFLFIYTDDQRWDAMSVSQREEGDKARFPWIKTPNMDRLAEEGIRFRNAFVVNSLCAPSRACFLTGKYSHLNGVANNHTPFPVDNVTHATLLRKAGYTTGYIGKWHMDGQSGQRPGFDYSASFVGQGRYMDCPIEVNGKVTQTKGWVDDVSADFAVGFLQKNKNKPFSLCVGFKSSHGPWQPPERLKDLYANEEAKPAPNASATAIYRKGAIDALPPGPDEAAAGKKRPQGQGGKGEMIRNYMRTLHGADENLGKILKALDELGLADNTMVIYTTDNGYYLGDHGLGDKRSAYEEALRIPLIIRYPRVGNRGKTCDAIALNLDLAETLADFAGAPLPADMQGRSWRPLIENPAAPPKDWRTGFFYEYFYERGFTTTPTITAVRTEFAKLIQYPGHPEWSELFDLGSDSIETRNLFSDPAYAALRKEMETEYAKQSKAIGYKIPPYADDPARDTGKKAGGKAGASKAAPGEALKDWVLDYRFDKDKGEQSFDASGQNNTGALKGDLPIVSGRDGHIARHFDGKAFIDIPKSKSLNPAGGPWTIDIIFRPESPDGVLIGRGGKSNGYCLYLSEGKLTFTVTASNRSSTVAAPESIDYWAMVTAAVTADQNLVLSVDNEVVAKTKLHAFIPSDPNDGMQIGADTGSPVVSDKKLPNFTGLIESVRLYSGEAP